MQSKKLLLATSNPGKAAEITAALAGLHLEILHLRDLPTIQSTALPVETGSTFAENATLKAEYWSSLIGLPVLADDSGISVDALADELGVATRRWGAGESASDAEWLAYFLKRMCDVPADQRTAEFVCVLALAVPNVQISNFKFRISNKSQFANSNSQINNRQSQIVKTFTGRVQGVITETIEAPIKPGIPLSSVFRPFGYPKVFAAMTDTEKNQFSHRGRALQELKDYLSRAGK
jgi:XTP/dITP diphosphohydrolase